MYYVYIIQSINHPNQIYVGCTEDLDKCLSNYNSGATANGEKYKPWKLIVNIAFEVKSKAYEFEEYLKSDSGRAFMNKRLLCLHKDINMTEFSLVDLTKFVNFVAKRFGVYLDTVQGFANNIEKMNLWQNQGMAMVSKSIDQLDQAYFTYGKELPPSTAEEFNEKSLHTRTQGQFKIDNSKIGINGDFAIYNCLSDTYNQWKLVKNNIGVTDDSDIPVMAYIAHLRNRTQHELYDDNKSIQANSLIEMQTSLSSYIFPKFHEGDSIRLSKDDCIALIKEIPLQIEDYYRKNIHNFQ